LVNHLHSFFIHPATVLECIQLGHCNGSGSFPLML
jgi:hypothetical protein